MLLQYKCYYNNKKDNQNERRVPISAIFDFKYLKMNSGYNVLHTHFSRILAVFLFKKY